jgi:hypothetical protein
VIINLEYDQNASMNAPQSWFDSMQAAANALDAAFVDNITINIAVGYGEFLGGALPNQNTSEGNIDYQGNDGSGFTVTYQQLRNLLISHATSSDDQTAVNNLPNTATLQGQGTFQIGSAQAKALGLLAGNNGALDGAIGMGTQFFGASVFNAALHELTHAMGRIAGDSLDIFRFNEDNSLNHVFGMAIPATPAYFSIDGGHTNLADFGVNSDPGDFFNGGVQDGGSQNQSQQDPFDETVGLIGLSSVDLTIMDVLGFTRVPPPPPPPGPPGPSRPVARAGDFNGDGRSDVLFQNSSGATWEWQLSSNQIIASNGPGNPGSSWHVVGTADFNGDGKADILYQNDSGQVWEWQMNGGQIVSSSSVGNPGSAWHVAGIGDFNGDGKSDILMQNNSGAIWQWQMNGSQIAASAGVGNPGSAWHVAEIGDFNGDGKSDIMFNNDSGQVWQWLMNGSQMTASNNVGNPGSTWPVV